MNPIVGVTYICQSCPVGPHTDLCEECYMSDERKGHSEDCEFEAELPFLPPVSWFSGFLEFRLPAFDGLALQNAPRLLRGVFRSQSSGAECVVGHMFVTADGRVYTAHHTLLRGDQKKKKKSSAADECDLYRLQPSTGASKSGRADFSLNKQWMNNRVENAEIDLKSFRGNALEDWASYAVLPKSGGGENQSDFGFGFGCAKWATTVPEAGTNVFVVTAMGTFAGVMMEEETTSSSSSSSSLREGRRVAMMCFRDPGDNLMISGSPMVTSDGCVVGILTRGALIHGRRMYGGIFPRKR